MNNQKLENLLNLALDTQEEERMRSEALSQGYNPREGTWQLIVKHTGSLRELSGAGIQIEELLGGYAILTAPQSRIEEISALPQIQFIEKPKRLYFALNQAKAASCISPVQQAPLNLSGRGVLVAVIDSGIDYYHQDFRNGDGTTRILMLWDQSLGRIFTEEEINQALAQGSREKAKELVPSADLSGHGTAVAGIAAGNGREANGQYRGVAYESSLLVVKLAAPRPDGFPNTVELMRAVDFVVRQAVERSLPVALNLSFGNTYGSHDGTSLLETFLNDMTGYGKNVIVAGAGNEGYGAGHSEGVLTMASFQETELSVGPYQTSFGVQLWKAYEDVFRISIITPSGRTIGPIDSRLGLETIDAGDTRILLYYGKPGPYSAAQEIYMDFIPVGNYVGTGIWKFRLTPQSIVQGRYDFWLPVSSVLNPSTRFLRPSPQTTLTIPSTAAKLLTVGAYDDTYDAYADFSGRGYTRRTRQVKPDLAAPGVNIAAPKAGGGYGSVTGTSFAAPVVTGSAALLMQWGIADGQDPFLYGEKVKAYFIRGARHLPGYEDWPNDRLGYGALCVNASLPT